MVWTIKKQKWRCECWVRFTRGMWVWLRANSRSIKEHKMEFRMCSLHALPQSVQDVRIKEHKMEFGMFSPHILFHNQYKMWAQRNTKWDLESLVLIHFSTISTRCDHEQRAIFFHKTWSWTQIKMKYFLQLNHGSRDSVLGFYCHNFLTTVYFPVIQNPPPKHTPF